FMVCAVLLPVVLLHFYVVFPRPKKWLQEHPRWAMVAMYGLPLGFLATMLGTYLYLRSLPPLAKDDVDHALAVLLGEIYGYLGVAAVWYLASIVCLLHSYHTASDVTERNQVKWILFGSLGA